MRPNKWTKPRLLYVVNVDWFFLSHRLPLALAARDVGFDVWVAAADTGEGNKIESHGLHFVPIPMSRSGTNIFAELRMMLFAYRLKRKIKPILVHHVAIKPVLYGSIITRLFFPRLPVVNAITGLGYAFSENKKASLFKPLIRMAYRFALKNQKAITIFQNPDDRNDFVKKGVVSLKQTKVIKGSGVDINVFKPSAINVDERIILFASRLIYDKGVKEFVDAAKMIKSTHPDVRFVLAGKPDEGNPESVPQEQIEDWCDKGTVEWWGHLTNMADILPRSSIVVLPTYYPEGVPKILIEAAACGKPLIATDRPGCREIVRHGINGILIPKKNPKALAKAIASLLDNPQRMQQYGQAGREIAVQEFSLERVINETLRTYKYLLGKNWPDQSF